jgi:hypothetical protein
LKDIHILAKLPISKTNGKQIHKRRNQQHYDLPWLNMNIFQELCMNYGPTALNHARHLEGATIKTAKWSNHLTFNHACIKANITPPSLRLVTNVGGLAAQRIIDNAQR